MGDNEEQEKSYAVNDKRGQERPKEEKQINNKTETQAKQNSEQTQNTPTINFTSFVLSISTSALVQMGLIPDPVSNETQKNMVLAKQQVDILEMLYQKTKGNLDDNEEKLMQQVLYELRMRYVEVKNQSQDSK